MNTKQRQQLKARAHKLKPVVIIGQNQLTEAVHNEIEVALTAHELMKIRVNARDKEVRAQMTKEICHEHGAEFIALIGHILIIYRKNEDL